MQNYLAHHGIEGQRKGIRRFQNEDGSLTPAGKERYGEWHPGKRKKTTLKEVRNKNGSYRYNIESEDGSKVGNISTYHQSDDSLRVSWISVDKNYKREGYASGAMDTLFNQAKEKGYKKVTVVIPKDDANVQHIYERLGFKPSNDGLTTDEVEDSITSLGKVVKMEYELEHSDTLDDVVGDYLMHYGVSVDDGAPGPGSGRYPKGSGERPYQHDENKDAGEKKKKGLFSALGAIHKALNPGFSAVDKAAEEAGRQLKEKEEAAKKEKEQEEDKKNVEQTSEKLSELNDAKTIMSDMDDFFKKYRERPDHDVSKEREEIFDKIENNWLSTSSGSREMRERMRTDPEFKKRVISACDLGLKGLDEMNGPGYVDWDAYKERPGNQREWFAIEDQTIGMLPIADLINRGYTGEQVGKLIDFIDEEGGELRVKENRPGYGCYFDVTEGWADELKPFARACERAKNKEINHSDLLDDFLAHYGVGPDDNPPGRGSGRYPKGSGERPFQRDPEMLAKKKKGLFAPLAKLATKITNKMEERDYAEMKKNLQNAGAWNSKMEDLFNRAKKTGEKLYDEYGDPTDDEKSKEEVRRLWGEFNAERDRLFALNKKNEQRKAALEKARETKAANKAKAEEEKKSKEEREAEKAKAIASGDPEQISKWLSEMSNQEQIDAINRIRNTQDIKDKAAAQVKEREDAARAEEQRIASQKAAEEARKRAIEEANRPKTKEEIRKEKYEKFMTATERTLQQASRIRDMAEKGIDIWNTIAAFNNTFNEEHEMPMIKRTDAYFKEKADKEAAKVRREQQLEDAKTKRENELADALRKEQREDEKWEKEFQAKYNKNSKDVDIKSTKSNSKSEPTKESSSETSKSAAAADYDGNDWYTPAQSIARKLLTSTAESRKEAAETGVKYWMTVLNGGNQALNPSTERESNTNHYRDMVNERERYNKWESEQSRKAADRMRIQSARNDITELKTSINTTLDRSKESQNKVNEQSLKRMAQQYKYAQSILKTRRQQRDRARSTGTNLEYYDKTVNDAREDLNKLSKDYDKFRKYL